MNLLNLLAFENNVISHTFQTGYRCDFGTWDILLQFTPMMFGSFFVLLCKNDITET